MIGKHPIRRLLHLNSGPDKAITWEGRSCNNYPVEGAKPRLYNLWRWRHPGEMMAEAVIKFSIQKINS
jgi:hypothetical protein